MSKSQKFDNIQKSGKIPSDTRRNDTVNDIHATTTATATANDNKITLITTTLCCVE